MFSSFETKTFKNILKNPTDTKLLNGIYAIMTKRLRLIHIVTWVFLTSASTSRLIMASRVSLARQVSTPSKYCERCWSALVTVMSRLLYVFSAAKFCVIRKPDHHVAPVRYATDMHRSFRKHVIKI